MNDYSGDPGRIEHELSETRARLGSHLEELTRRLSPGQLIDEGLSYLRDGQGATFVRNLGGELRDNPLPVALTAIGVAWLAIAGSTSGSRSIPRNRAMVPYDQARSWRAESSELAERARRAGDAISRGVEETEETFRERVADARARILGLQRDAAETASAFAERVQQAYESTQQTTAAWRDEVAARAGQAGEAVSDAARRGRDFAARAGSGMADAMNDNPLLLGALGLAAGVMLGALLPKTRQEEELLRPAADWVSQTTDDMVARGTQAAQAAASAAYEEAVRE